MSPESGRNAIYRIGAVCLVIVFVLFVLGMIGIVIVLIDPGVASGWFTLLEDNWLVVLFKLNMGLQASLGILNPLDLGIMALFCLIFFALFLVLRKTSKTWSLIAMVLPFLGMPIFIITGTAGRSTLLISGLIISVVMVRCLRFNKSFVYIGILASGLLFFAGDIATAIFSSSSVIALFILVGYVLWMIWIVLMASYLAHYDNNTIGLAVPENNT